MSFSTNVGLHECRLVQMPVTSVSRNVGLHECRFVQMPVTSVSRNVGLHECRLVQMPVTSVSRNVGLQDCRLVRMSVSTKQRFVPWFSRGIVLFSVPSKRRFYAAAAGYPDIIRWRQTTNEKCFMLWRKLKEKVACNRYTEIFFLFLFTKEVRTPPHRLASISDIYH